MKKSHVLSLLFGLCLVALFETALTVHGQESVTLIGTVKGQDNSPKSGARVEFNPNGYVAVTDRNGRFSVRNFLPGWYSVTVREGGNYQRFRLNIQSTLDLKISW